MKKIYVSAFLLTLTAGGFAQSITKVYPFAQPSKALINVQPSTNKKPVADSEDKALNILWTENFSGGAGAMQTANGQWTAAGQNTAYWAIGNLAHPLSSFGWTENLAAEYLRWNSYGPNNAEANFATTSVGGEVISPSIDLSGLTNTIGIQFKTEAMYCCNFQYKPFGIAVSNDDGATWSATMPIDFGVGRNEATEDIAKPLSVSLNLSSIAPSTTSTFKFKFIWDGLTGDSNGQFNTHYFWLIDDIEIYELPDNDLSIKSTYWGTEGLNYYQIPLAQVAPIDFTVKVLNNGGATQTGVQLNVNVNSGAFTGTSPAVSIASGASDSLVLSTPFTPSAVGSYAITRTLTQDQTDDIPADNSMTSITMSVTDNIYARDNNVASGSTDNDGFGYESGNLFDIWEDATVHSIRVRLRNTTAVGSTVYAKVYSIDPGTGDFVEEGVSNYHEVVSANLSGFLNLPLIFPVGLAAGNTYLAVIASDGSAGVGNDMVVSTAGLSDPQTSFFYDATDLTWYFTTNTPMVRMDFQNQVGIEESNNAFGVNVHPNPGADNVTVTYEVNNASDVNVVVKDMTGKVIETINNKAQAEGTHKVSLNASTYASGVYYVSVSTNNATVTKKFVKK